MRLLKPLIAFAAFVPASLPAAQVNSAFVIDRASMRALAGCIVARVPDRVHRLLVLEPETGKFKTRFASIRNTNVYCARSAVKSKKDLTSSFVYLGFLAERLVTTRAVLVSRTVAGDEVSIPFVKDARFAMAVNCLATAAPDDVQALFATEPDSANEKAAFDRLGAPWHRCAGLNPTPVTNDNLRSLLAIVVFRRGVAAGTAMSMPEHALAAAVQLGPQHA